MVSSFESRWLSYAPDNKKVLETPKKATDKTDKSPLEPQEAIPHPPSGTRAGHKTQPDALPMASTAPTATPDTLPRLPWQLERLLSAAASNVLTVVVPGVPDVPRYTLAWAAVYLLGDRDEALSRLWAVYRAWQSTVSS